MSSRRATALLAIAVIGTVVVAALMHRLIEMDSGADPPRQVGLSPFQQAKVEFILANRLACLGCHSLNGRGGRLGPDLTDVGQRMSAADIEAVIANPRSRNPRSMMPPLPMPPAWRSAVAAYLGDEGGAGAETLVGSPLRAPAVDREESGAGPALYAHFCSGCHGNGGDGDGPNARYLPVAPARHTDPVRMGARSDDWLFDIIARGGYPIGRHVVMPGYQGILGPESIRALVKHVRDLCGCVGPSWSRDNQRSKP